MLRLVSFTRCALTHFINASQTHCWWEAPPHTHTHTHTPRRRYAINKSDSAHSPVSTCLHMIEYIKELAVDSFGRGYWCCRWEKKGFMWRSACSQIVSHCSAAPTCSQYCFGAITVNTAHFKGRWAVPPTSTELFLNEQLWVEEKGDD